MDLSKQRGASLLQIWKNAVGRLDDPVTQTAAREMIGRIWEEWSKRKAKDQWFPWPSTDAPLGDEPINSNSWPEEGMLSALGYHVGITHGVSASLRRRILREIVDGELPPLNSHEYTAEWGEPGTADRLRKLAETIASLTRNEKRRRQVSLQRAIDEREADLRMLRDEYYVGEFNFGWPDTGI